MAELDAERARMLAEVLPDVVPGARWFAPDGGVWVWSGEKWEGVESGVGEGCRWCGRVRPDHAEGCPVRVLAQGIARTMEP